MRMKDLLHDLTIYTDLSVDQQKEIREMYNLTKEEVNELQKEVLAIVG